MLKQRARTLAVTVFLLDLLLVAMAFGLAHQLRDRWLPAIAPESFGGHLYPLREYLPLLPIALLIWGTLLLTSGRYRSQRVVPLLTEAWAIVRVCGSALVIFTLTLFALRLDEIVLETDRASRAFLLLFATLACLLLLGEKVALRLTARYARSRGFNYRSVLIVGTNEAAQAIAQSIQQHRFWGFRLLGLIATSRGAREQVLRYPVLGDLDDLPRITQNNVVDDVIFAVGRRELGRLEELFLSLHEQGVRCLFALNLFPHTRAKVDLSEIDGIPVLTFAAAPTGHLQMVAKRVVDVALSMLLLALALPAAVVIALAIKLTAGGAVLFRQTRCGLNGRLFTLYKFRTMVEDAEDKRRGLQHLNEMVGPTFKLRSDPRVTALGRFLRKFSLDELPQLWNVLKGDMSLVGPRPPIPEEVARYQRWHRRRLAMKPGLTCLWQISGRNNVDFDRWMELDLEYIDSWSPWLDLKILAKTIPVVLSGRGAS